MILQRKKLSKERGNCRPAGRFSTPETRKVHLGLRSTRMTESPRRNIFGTNLSRATRARRCPFVEAPPPLPALGASVHISLTFSRTMLQCRSKAWRVEVGLFRGFRFFCVGK